MTRVFAAVAIFQLLLGCGTQQMYEGSKRLPEQIALLKPGSPTVLSSLANDPALVIDEIDGNPPRQRVTVDTPIFEVLPGKHRVKATLVSVSASYVSRSPSKIIEFEVKAGEAYTIFYRWRNRRESDWILFVKEDRTGNVIAEY